MAVRKSGKTPKRLLAEVRCGAACIAILAALWIVPLALAQSDKAWFEGKTIQLLVASGAGATTDFGARLARLADDRSPLWSGA